VVSIETFPYLALWYSIDFLSIPSFCYPVGIPHSKLCSVEMNASIHTFRERRSSLFLPPFASCRTQHHSFLLGDKYVKGITTWEKDIGEEKISERKTLS
jgi:hypothetical protein